MKKLCLFRHAKSTYASLGTDDIDRSLHELGKKNAPMMGEVLSSQHKFKPDLILASYAKRTRETATLIASALQYPEDKIQTSEKLYEAGVEDLLHEINQLDPSCQSLLLIGHNPGLTLLANFLCDEHINNLPTCGLIGFEFNTNSWDEFANTDSKVLFIDEPKNHL